MVQRDRHLDGGRTFEADPARRCPGKARVELAVDLHPARFEAGLGVNIRPPLDVSFLPVSGEAEIEVTAGLEIGRDDQPMAIIGEVGGSGLFLDRFSGS
ncbi:MAG: hypothetical protein AAFV62_12695, partial [Pseudomonadota bacterium]